MYGFNNSHMKIIHVRLQRTNEGIFKPLVKLTGNNGWNLFRRRLLATVYRQHEIHKGSI